MELMLAGGDSFPVSGGAKKRKLRRICLEWIDLPVCMHIYDMLRCVEVYYVEVILVTYTQNAYYYILHVLRENI